MNYKQARQLKDGGWKFTNRHDHQIYAIGYCADHDAHETKEQAEECYKKYILDRAKSVKFEDQQLKCRVCGSWTQRAFDLRFEIYPLCDVHLNKTELEKLVPRPSQIIDSYG